MTKLTPAEIQDLLKGTVLFRQLSQPMRCWAIVGCYIGHFALLELAVSSALRILLDLDSLATAIFARNMGMIEKVQAVRTPVNIAAPTNAKATLNDLLKRAKSAAEERNIVAHVPFGESETGGVQFHAVDAKGTFRATVLEWSLEASIDKIDELREIEIGLNSERSKAAFDDTRRVIKGSPRTMEEWLRELGLPPSAAPSAE